MMIEARKKEKKMNLMAKMGRRFAHVWTSTGRIVAFVGICLFAAVGFAAESITITATPRYPWNGKVDLKFTIDGTSGTKYDTSFTAKDVAGGTNLTMKTLYKADGTSANVAKEQLLPGTYNWVWNATADLGEGTVLEKVVVEGKAEKVLDIDNATYMVIDLSGGSSAKSYPVSYLDAVPSGGWTDAYKTTKLVLRRCEAGTFTMDGYGSSKSHKVILTKAFYIGVFEVTQKQYQQVTGGNPSYHVGNMLPVENMTWLDIRNGSESFIGRLQNRCGQASLDLPTEAQWEYAGKGGGKLGEVAAAGGPSEVGSKAANGWGIYDMQGNVDEWMIDGWVQYGTETCTDPKGSDKSVRVIKGGYYGQTGADPCKKIGYRTNENQIARHQYTGFRVCVTVK